MLLTLLALVVAAPPVEKPLKPLPSLAKELTLDGDVRDFKPATEFKMPEAAHGSTSALDVSGSFRKDTLYVAVTVQDDQVLPDDQLEITLFFPGAGTTARGFTYRFGVEGARPAVAEAAAPEFATKLVRHGIHADKKGWSVELAFPPRSLPRFQAFKPLALTMCADYADVDQPGSTAQKITSCPVGDMVGGPTRLPDDFRKAVKLNPPSDVEGVEARETGWVGVSKLHYPTWVSSDAALTPELLATLVAGDSAVDPAAASLPIPRELKLNDNRPLFTVLTGKNPYLAEGCNSSNELRLVMYVVKGRTANRVLEWPASTCSLGRAMRFELGPDGTLAIGFTNGATQHFVWADEHFERSELGRADTAGRSTP